MDEEQALDAMIDAAGPVLGIAVAETWREAIRLHLRISLGHAHNVAGFTLPDEAEPAPVFHP